MDPGATQVGGRESQHAKADEAGAVGTRSGAAEVARRGIRRAWQAGVRATWRVRASPAARALRDLDQREARSALYRTVFDEAPVGMALLDDGLRLVDVNEELVRMVGRSRDELRGQPLTVLASQDQPGRLGLMARKAASGAAAGAAAVVVEHRYPRPGGAEGWARTSIRRIGGGDPVVSLVCTLEDLTSDQIALEEQRRQAELDPLTGLLNRRGGDRRLRGALEKLAQSGPVAVILCDADRFKEINDRFGHAAGDELLSGVASRLRAAIRSGDDVARIGGDEFIIVARVANSDEAAAIARRCIGTTSQPFAFRVEGHPPQEVTLSAGVAVAYPGGPVEPGSLLAAADRALYQAKAAGGGTWKLASGT
ncbi:MAG TPA: sensor domain-containing diguanylate cyclase [Acidimicrobiales bacterium]|nr:sensor domain-containing diguanylate cyclase [Acidimicrobiales bacterium]